MMKKELFKLRYNYFLFIIFAIVILSVFGVSLYYGVHDRQEAVVGYDVGDYLTMDSFDDVKKSIAESRDFYRGMYQSGDMTLEDYEAAVEYLDVNENICAVLMSRGITKENVLSADYTEDFIATKPMYFRFICCVFQVCLVVVFAVFALFVFNIEFQNGTAKLTYGGGKKQKVLLTKLLLCAVFYVATITVFVIFAFAFSAKYGMGRPYVYLTVGTECILMTAQQFLWRSVLSLALETLFWFVCFIVIGLFVRNVYAAFLGDVLIYSLFYALRYTPFKCVALPLVISTSNGVGGIAFLISTLIKYFIVSLALVLAVFSFKKRDII